jgi:CBS domain-containing protein
MTKSPSQPAYYELLDLLTDLLQRPEDIQKATGLITDFADRVLQEHVQSTIEEMGEAPVPWALALFGSEGRREQTLRTDQDNALILSDEATDNAEVLRWFQRFGQAINDKLNASGYHYCNGGIMAGNVKWCVPVKTWKQYFKKWVIHPEPMAVMQSTIFFDLRHGAGSSALTTELQHHLLQLLADKQEVFFYHMVQNALNVQIPPASLRKLWLWFYPHPDLKYLSLPVTSTARIMALRNGVQEQHTGLRLQAISSLGKLQHDKALTLQSCFDDLSWLRLRAQVQGIQDGQEPDNILHYGNLTHNDKAIFRDALDGVLLARTMLRNAIGAYF